MTTTTSTGHVHYVAEWRLRGLTTAHVERFTTRDALHDYLADRRHHHPEQVVVDFLYAEPEHGLSRDECAVCADAEYAAATPPADAPRPLAHLTSELAAAVAWHTDVTDRAAENDRDAMAGRPLSHWEDGIRSESRDVADTLAALAVEALPVLRTLARDRKALDEIAGLLGTNAEWDSTYIETVANIVGRHTERPHPGDAFPEYRIDFLAATGRRLDPEWDDTSEALERLA